MNKLENRLEEIDNKLDTIIEEVNHQRLKRQAVDDLIADLSIIGKDTFETTVNKLDNAGIELDTDALENLGLRVIRNIDNINKLFELIESLLDLSKDLAPVIHQIGLNAIKKLYKYEEKGYFDFIDEFTKMIDRIMTQFSKEDIKMLSDNIILVLDALKITKPKDIKPYSTWKTIRNLNSKEIKHSISFMIEFLKNLENTNSSKSIKNV